MDKNMEEKLGVHLKEPLSYMECLLNISPEEISGLCFNPEIILEFDFDYKIKSQAFSTQIREAWFSQSDNNKCWRYMDNNTFIDIQRVKNGKGYKIKIRHYDNECLRNIKNSTDKLFYINEFQIHLDDCHSNIFNKNKNTYVSRTFMDCIVEDINFQNNEDYLRHIIYIFRKHVVETINKEYNKRASS